MIKRIRRVGGRFKKAQADVLQQYPGLGSGGVFSRDIGNGTVVRTEPRFYSPFLLMSSLMLPRDRITMNAWVRHFYETNPFVKNTISLHATLPITKFRIICEDKAVGNYFKELLEKIDFNTVLLDVALEYWKMGEAFPYAEFDKNKGEWKRIVVQNPDFILVYRPILGERPSFYLIPDPTMKSILSTSTPEGRKLKDSLSPDILNMLSAQRKIPLSNNNLSHLKHISSAYDVRGVSIITSVFKDLMLYDRLLEAKYAQADDMINPITLIKLGEPNGEWRPTQEDFNQFRELIISATYDPNFKIITHGGVTIERVGASGQIIDTSADFERIEKNILTGLLSSQAVTHGEGPTYATSAVSIEVLKGRYLRFQSLLSQWMRNKIFAPICMLNDFIKKEKGTTKLIIPEIRWDGISLREVESYMNLVINNEDISEITKSKILDLDWDVEISNKQKTILDKIKLDKIKDKLSGLNMRELSTIRENSIEEDLIAIEDNKLSELKNDNEKVSENDEISSLNTEETIVPEEESNLSPLTL